MPEFRTVMRALGRTPGFTLAGIGTLAIAAGALNAVFAVVFQVLLKRLPVRDQGEVVVAWKKDLASGFDHWPFTYPSVRAIAPQLTTVSATATADYNGAYPLSMVDGDQGVTLMTGIISGSLMPLLGVQPVLGRTILPADDDVGAPRVAVLSEAFWKSHYGSDPAILTRTFQMSGETYQIVGVVPGFDLPAGSTLWITVRPFQNAIVESEYYALANLVVRLKPGVSIDQFQAELETVRGRTPNEAGEGYKSHRIVVKPLQGFIVGEARPTLLLLLGGVALLLLVAVANLGGLFLVRSGSRLNEIAIRSAIGGGAVRSIRTLAGEFILVIGLGALLGVPAGWMLLKFLTPLLPPELPTQGGVSLRLVPVTLSVLGAVLAGLLGGLPPLLAVRNADFIAALRSGGRAVAKGWGMHPIRRVMVGGQIALAVMIVAGAGLLLKTLQRMERVDPGFRPEGVLLFDLADSRKYDSTLGPRRNDVDRILAKVGMLPGVTSASAVLSPPFVGHAGFYVKFVPGDMTDKEAMGRLPYANTDVVYPTAATTLGLRLISGRFIESSDRENGQLVVVLNETLARTLYPAGDAIGKLVRPPTDSAAERALVVGVVGDTRYNEWLKAVPMAYLSYRQFEWIPGNFLVRTESDAAARALVPQIRAAVQEAMPAAAVRRAATINELLEQPLVRPRLVATLVTSFAFVVLTLAAIGIYSVMASFVVQRTREIGVRMALGATGGMVHRLVFRQGLMLTLIGLSVGLTAGLLGGRLLRGFLYEVPASDPMIFGGVALLLFVVASLAVLVPSMRAARLEPVEALRSE
ncbi:MAG TPA: ADOP family duplicated permease [Gemmatimonadales bacterium]|nr:ADOP family duplicated permease [Gemmatimonadales bacterium]